jgi:hypothetical protein
LLCQRGYFVQNLNSTILRSQGRFAALEKLNDSDDTNRAWENFKENIKTSAK